MKMTKRSISGFLVLTSVSLALAACASELATPSVSASPSSSMSPPVTSTPVDSPSASASAEPTASPPASSGRRVDVVIVTVGADEGGVYASGIVPDLTETGGTCMLTAVNGSTELSATRQGEGATGSTNCGLLRVDVGAGAWELTLSYVSATAEGESAPEAVTVP